MSRALTEFAPAKINLALAVTGLRPDGYHLIDTIAVFADIGDTIDAEPADTLLLAVEGPFAAGLADTTANLVLKAARALRSAAETDGLAVPGARLRLTKRLPVASGIGGGSADAAATLRALNRLWDLNWDAARLAALGATIGADVPMCMYGRPLRARGIGERVELLADFPALHLVLVNPGVGVSTAEVFTHLAGKTSEPLPELPRPCGTDDVVGLLETTANALEAPAATVAPIMAEVLAALRASPGCRLARMSGSGATCFGIFPQAGIARSAAAGLAGNRSGWWVEPTVTRGS